MEADQLTPDILLRAYAIGLFPMAEDADDPSLHWVEPKHRGIFPLDGFHVPRKLARLVRQDGFEVVADRNFAAVIDACAAPAKRRETTWINGVIRQLYLELHAMDHAHSVEVYRDGELVGGLYGVSLAGAFFGESMFHRVTDASKVALVHLVGRLNAGGYRLLDAQFITQHLAQFGAIEIPRSAYKRRLEDALSGFGNFSVWPLNSPESGEQALSAIAAATAKP